MENLPQGWLCVGATGRRTRGSAGQALALLAPAAERDVRWRHATRLTYGFPMTISSIPGVQFIKDTDRCYEYALDFVLASVALGAYLNAYHGQAVTSFAPNFSAGPPQYPTAVFAGKASGKNLEIVPHELLTSVLVKDTRAGAIPYLSPPSFPSLAGNSTGAMAETLEGFAQAMFTRYYENNLAKIERAYDKRSKNQWPAVLQFSAVIRDAMSHGGTIHMFPPVPPVSHFNLTYAPADNGRKVIHNDLSCADIFFLMLEMDAAF